MRNKAGIYFVINPENGKMYVGQTIDLFRRESNHRKQLAAGKHCNRYLQFAFNKAADKDFIYYVAELCVPDNLTEREQYWMDLLGKDRIYNLAPAGGSCLGVKHDAEFSAAISRRMKGRPQPAHVREAVSLSNATRKISNETRKKLADASRRRTITAETRKKLSAANKGRPLSEEHKVKLSIARSKVITAFGKSMGIAQWSAETGIPVTTIQKRLDYGWAIEDAVSRPRRNYRTQLEAHGANLGVQFSAPPSRMAA